MALKPSSLEQIPQRTKDLTFGYLREHEIKYDSNYSSYDYHTFVYIQNGINQKIGLDFLPWNRAFLYQFEHELQSFIHESFRLSFWDLTNQLSTFYCLSDETFVGGNGIDTYRMWEGLIFGHITIVMKSSFDSLYKSHPQLPIVIVERYSGVNESLLIPWYNKYKNSSSLNNQNTQYSLTNECCIQYIRQFTMK